ncbi:MAG: alpha-mannosidase, partial [Chloroflexota bacterium]
MESITAHIINHTHWDREWFLTSVYTSPWIAGLIDKLAGLVEQNPDFHFFLDGQTLVIEDLIRLHPHYQNKVEQLVRSGNLQIGPYYCQPDWRMTTGEALLRNLLFGRQDMKRYGISADAGWLVDTFGHISQAPQIHGLFGITSVYIWRGAPQMQPFFYWQGADGTRLFTINLFGGYRNLYGVTHVPEIAAARLQAEIEKLAPYYPTRDVPLFDGYDLEDNPEDPLRFYRESGSQVPPQITVQEATPGSFAQAIQQNDIRFPLVAGELISGKYGAVFPGT